MRDCSSTGATILTGRAVEPHGTSSNSRQLGKIHPQSHLRSCSKQQTSSIKSKVITMPFWSKNKAPTFPNKTVLIIGGGIAGLAAAYQLRTLDPEVKIHIIDPKAYGEILWASYRSPFEEWVAKGSVIRLDKFCELYKVEHLQATVTKLTKEACEIEYLKDSRSETLSFDVCVVAAGASADWKAMGRSLPVTMEQATPESRLRDLKAEGERLLSAQHIVIIGGGLIGTELAGDIRGYALKKKNTDRSQPRVTVVHSGTHVCPIMSEQAAAAMTEDLKKLGVEIICNEKATDREDGTVVLTNSGKEMKGVDIVIKTIGFQAMNRFVDIPNVHDNQGWLKTDEYFLLPGTSNMFAFGDCSKTLPDAANQYMNTANLLASNVQVALQQEGDMKQVEIPFAAFCNTAGPNGGVLYSPLFWTRMVMPWLKNKTMLFFAPKGMAGIKSELTMAGT